MDSEVARERALDAAERLFYGRGVQAVGMDDVRGDSGVSAQTPLPAVPGQGAARGGLPGAAGTCAGGSGWRNTSTGTRNPAPGFWPSSTGSGSGSPNRTSAAARGSTRHGELGATSAPVADRVRAHKGAFREFLDGLAAGAGLPAAVGGQLFLLAEGAMVTAGVTGGTEPARGRHVRRRGYCWVPPGRIPRRRTPAVSAHRLRHGDGSGRGRPGPFRVPVRCRRRPPGRAGPCCSRRRPA